MDPKQQRIEQAADSLIDVAMRHNLEVIGLTVHVRLPNEMEGRLFHDPAHGTWSIFYGTPRHVGMSQADLDLLGDLRADMFLEFGDPD